MAASTRVATPSPTLSTPSNRWPVLVRSWPRSRACARAAAIASLARSVYGSTVPSSRRIALTEVTGCRPDRHVERFEAVGIEVDHPVGALQPAPDQQRVAQPGHLAVAQPQAGRTGDVEHARLILQVDEGDPTRPTPTLAGGGHFSPP